MENTRVDLSSFDPAKLSVLHFSGNGQTLNREVAVVPVFSNPVSDVSGEFLLGERHTGLQVFSGLAGEVQGFSGQRGEWSGYFPKK